ncbi:MAG: transglutaminase-like domain-containing protein [Bacilli bacterium]|nr:transglutaminase-like domain-containing protein [Bacilli bacterium]
MIIVDHNDLQSLIVNDKNSKVKGSLKEFTDIFRNEKKDINTVQEIYLVLYKFLDAENRLYESDPVKYEKTEYFRNNSSEIFESRVGKNSIGFSMVNASVLRKLGIPTVLVEGIKMSELFINGEIEEHMFLEVYLNNTWILVDSTSGFVYGKYDKENRNLPNGYYAASKSISGIALDNEHTHEKLLKEYFSNKYVDYKDPNYPIIKDFLMRERVRVCRFSPDELFESLAFEDDIDKVPDYTRQLVKKKEYKNKD